MNASPYPIKGWVVYGQNILESIPQRQNTLKAIEQLEFMAVVDVLPVEQTNYADLVLPEATYLERYDPPAVTTSKRPFVAIRQPAIEPLYESKPGWWIAKQLANRMGLVDYFPWKDPEDHLSRLVQPLGINLAELNRWALCPSMATPTSTTARKRWSDFPHAKRKDRTGLVRIEGPEL